MKGIQILKQYLQVWFVAFSEWEFIVTSGLINCVGSNQEIPNTKWHLRRDSDWERTAKFLRMEKLIADLDIQFKFLDFT